MNTLREKSARYLGPLFSNNPHRIIGLDGAFSIPLDRARTLLFFGDTLIGRRIPGQSLWYIDGQPVGAGDMSGRGGIDRMINNSGAIARSSPSDFSVIVDGEGKPKCLVPL